MGKIDVYLVLALICALIALVFLSLGSMLNDAKATIAGFLMLFLEIFWFYRIKNSKDEDIN